MIMNLDKRCYDFPDCKNCPLNHTTICLVATHQMHLTFKVKGYKYTLEYIILRDCYVNKKDDHKKTLREIADETNYSYKGVIKNIKKDLRQIKKQEQENKHEQNIKIKTNKRE